MNDYSKKRESRITVDSQKKYHPNHKGENKRRNGFYTFANTHNMHRIKELISDDEDNRPLQALQSNVTSNKYVLNTVVKLSRRVRRINVAGNNVDLSTDFHAAVLLAF